MGSLAKFCFTLIQVKEARLVRHLKHLHACDVYRDGGSFGVVFTLENGMGYSLWLARHPQRFQQDYNGPRHKYLYESWSHQLPDPGCSCPIVTSSPEETGILEALDQFLQNPDTKARSGDNAASSLGKLKEMVCAIRAREEFEAADTPSYWDTQRLLDEKRSKQIHQAEIKVSHRVAELDDSSAKSDEKCIFARCRHPALKGKRLCATHLMQ